MFGCAAHTGKASSRGSAVVNVSLIRPACCIVQHGKQFFFSEDPRHCRPTSERDHVRLYFGQGGGGGTLGDLTIEHATFETCILPFLLWLEATPIFPRDLLTHSSGRGKLGADFRGNISTVQYQTSCFFQALSSRHDFMGSRDSGGAFLAVHADVYFLILIHCSVCKRCERFLFDRDQRRAFVGFTRVFRAK